MDEFRNYFGPRMKKTTKYDYGHVLIVGGSQAYLGAAILAALGANRSGCGLVTLAVPGSLVDIARIKVLPEIMVFAIPGQQKQEVFSPYLVACLLEWLRKRKVRAIGIGPGLGSEARTVKFTSEFLSQVNVPVVVDADALRVFSYSEKTSFSCPLVLTPHAGEIARIFGVSLEEIEQRRSYFCRELAKKTGAIVVLKGYRSLISNGKEVLVNHSGGPGLARGGSGDVLTGLLAGMLATRKKITREEIWKTVVLGVYWHGLAGEIAARKNTEVAMNIDDVISCLPEAAQQIKAKDFGDFSEKSERKTKCNPRVYSGGNKSEGFRGL